MTSSTPEFVVKNCQGHLVPLCEQDEGSQSDEYFLSGLGCSEAGTTPQRPLCLSLRFQSWPLCHGFLRSATLRPARWPQRPPSQWVLTVRSLSTGKNACPDDPYEQHENHAHGEGVEHQGEHDSDTSLIGSVVRIQLVHFVLATFDTEQWAEE